MALNIKIDPLKDGRVVALLEEHLIDMRRESPPESVHALDTDKLNDPSLTFWSCYDSSATLGCIALKELSSTEAEIKSMRTSTHARGLGVATELLTTLIREAKSRGYTVLRLETGSMDFFIPARKLYEKFGFSYREPFGDYHNDPNSLFMEYCIS